MHSLSELRIENPTKSSSDISLSAEAPMIAGRLNLLLGSDCYFSSNLAVEDILIRLL
jgi:hypothetical protein